MHIATFTDIRALELSLIAIFTFLLLYISLSSGLKDVDSVKTNKFLLVLTKCSINISISLMQLAKKQYYFFVFNKIFACLAQIFINLSYTIMVFVNKLT